jgi:hypothetical protein
MLDLDYLEGVARAAEGIYDEAAMFVDEGWPLMKEPIFNHVAVFDPPTVLEMIAELRVLAGLRALRAKLSDTTPAKP